MLYHGSLRNRSLLAAPPLDAAGGRGPLAAGVAHDRAHEEAGLFCEVWGGFAAHLDRAVLGHVELDPVPLGRGEDVAHVTQARRFARLHGGVVVLRQNEANAVRRMIADDGHARLSWGKYLVVEKNPITPEGYARLRDELNHLRSVERPRVIQMIATAREHGDLSENAEYHAAREKQSFIEGRVKEIEAKLALAEIIDPSKLSGDRVSFGATVKLSNSQSGEETSYRILGADEADINQGTISISSPLARSLLGKEVGDEVKVRMPGGERVYEVLEIAFK